MKTQVKNFDKKINFKTEKSNWSQILDYVLELKTLSRIVIVLSVLASLQLISLAALGNAKQFKFTNNTGQHANDLHIEFSRTVTFHPNANDPGTPIQDPTGTFKNASGSGASTVNLAEGVSGTGVANGASVTITVDWPSGSEPNLRSARWTKSNTLSPGRNDWLGNPLRFDRANNTWVMNTATGNGQYIVMIDQVPYPFQTISGADGMITAMMFADFIRSLPFGDVLAQIDNSVLFTGNSLSDGPNVEFIVIQQDLTQPVMSELIPSPLPSEAIWTERITPNSARLRWLPDPSASHYVITGRMSTSSSLAMITVPAAGNPGFKDVFGLANNTDYIWQIETYVTPFNQMTGVQMDAIGSGSSEADTFRTGCQTPTGLIANDLGGGHLEVYWDATPGAAGYELHGSIAGNTGGATVQFSGNGNTGRVFQGLLPNVYELKVRSVCLQGVIMSPYSDPILTSVSGTGTNRLGSDESLVEKEEATFDINVFPNPATSGTNVVVNSKQGQKISVTVIDLSGKLVWAEDFIAENSTTNISIPTTDFENGLYQVLISTDDLFERKELMIAR